MNRVDLDQPTMQSAVAYLREGNTLQAAANKFGVGLKLLQNNLKRAGLYQEFAFRKFTGERGAEVLAPEKFWDVGMANKRLKMALRRAQL